MEHFARLYQPTDDRPYFRLLLVKPRDLKYDGAVLRGDLSEKSKLISPLQLCMARCGTFPSIYFSPIRQDLPCG